MKLEGDLRSAVIRLQRKRCGTIVLRTSDTAFESCDAYLQTLPDVCAEGFQEHPAATALALLRWALQHDMAFDEPVVADALVEDVIAEIQQKMSTGQARFFLSVVPEETVSGARPWGEFATVLGATFEFGLVLLTATHSLLLVVQDED